jgi:broad specificity phosphatase PhoE
MKKIYLIRHGETDYFKNKHQSDSHLKQDDNTPLNKNGVKNSIITGKYLKFREKNDPTNKIDLIISSPLLRAKQTAEHIAKELEYSSTNIMADERITDIKLTEKYKNMTVGEFRKLSETDEEIKNYYKYYKIRDEITTAIELNDFIIKNEINDSNKVFENIKIIGNRVDHFIEGLKVLKFNNIIVVTHGKIISWLIKLMSNIVGNEFIKGDLFNNNSFCAITLYLEKDNEFVLHTINSNNHLKGSESKEGKDDDVEDLKIEDLL